MRAPIECDLFGDDAHPIDEGHFRAADGRTLSSSVRDLNAGLLDALAAPSRPP